MGDFILKIYSADKTPLNILRILTAVITVILLILCRLFIPFYMLMIILMSIFSAVGIILIFFYFPEMFRNLEFYFSEDTITKKYGVFFKREQTINISSVQYITTGFCRLEGFCFIVLNVYGGTMIIPFLSNRNFRSVVNQLEYTVKRK